MINLITTDSYFNMFDLLLKNLKTNRQSIDQKNIIFCEEKVSLMIERLICYEFGGTFNTEVFSFGNFLRAQKPMDNLLTIEGSSMAVKKILSAVKLNCFKASKATIAPTLYNLIIQLKSAKVTPSDILTAIQKTDGILKNKLTDIYEVFSAYEDFVQKNGFEDQSSYLSHLGGVIENAQVLSGANIYLVGFSGFTAQMREAVNALIKRTNNLTAILCEGDNPLVFVNESAYFIKQLCKDNNYPLLYKNVKSNYSKNGRIIVDSIFNPFAFDKKSIEEKDFDNNGDVYCYFAPNPIAEIERVGQIIKQKILSGECRYKDITIALPSNEYVPIIQKAFANLEIPYFIDERKKAEHHPLIKLILSYIDVMRKNFDNKALVSFAKNPYFCDDKSLVDNFENYLIKYNIKGYRIKQPFTLSSGEDLDELNEFREKLISNFDKFDLLALLERLDVKNKSDEFTKKLIELGEIEEGAICAQTYDKTLSLLSQIKLLLGDEKLTLKEYRSIFTSGISALEMSIIPQFNDAVFIGNYKQTALAKAKHLFAIGLTNALPSVQTDVSLLSDGDIESLEKIKVLVEPKINIVNHRNRENFALGLSAFDKSLYLSYPVCDIAGAKTFKSQALDDILSLVEYKPFEQENGYLTVKQGLKTFAKECGEFSDGKRIDLANASSFYSAKQSDLAKDIIDRANVGLQERLTSSKEILISKEISPTAIEDYYKCPYMSFLSHALRITKREEGEVDFLSVGSLMHQIFDEFVSKMSCATDKESCDKLFEEIAKGVLEREEYKKFLLESSTSTTIKRVLSECKKYCYKTFMSFSQSEFKVEKSEAKFGENGYYPPINLVGGKIKMKGKIDRVDQTDKFVRIIDYKTGSTDSSEKALFAGVKLQLFLYGYAVSQGDKDKKQVAGLYYLPISDKYLKDTDEKSVLADGHTLDESDAISCQDQSFYQNGKSEFMPIKLDSKGQVKNAIGRDEINRFMDYAVSVSELGASQLIDGVIVPSPYERTCDYCQFKGICKMDKQMSRKIGAISSGTIVKAKKESENV